MNNELPDGPEYVFAQAVIDRLAGQEELKDYVMATPFDKGDQVNNLALAVGSMMRPLRSCPRLPSRLPGRVWTCRIPAWLSPRRPSWS